MADPAKAELVRELLKAKAESKKTFTEIGKETGHTNAYVAQLFHRQAQLKPSAVEALGRAVPSLTDAQLEAMQEIPLRTYDPNIIQDPTIYRLHEAVMQYAESLKAIIHEEGGDGIMSAIGFFCEALKVKGKEGEDRIVITFNGKYLPFTEQKTSENVASVSRIVSQDLQ